MPMPKSYVLLLALLLLAAPADAETAGARSDSYVLGPVHVDKIYPSMTGPVMRQQVQVETDGDSTRWVTGMHAEVLDKSGAQLPSEYLCHAWVIFGRATGADQKMLTISEGLDSMSFPKGFAVPVGGKARDASLLAQALNGDAQANLDLSYKLVIDSVDDATAKREGLRALRTISLAVMAKDANPSGSSEICRAQDETENILPAGQGMEKSVVHFDVPPGRHEYRSILPKTSPIYMGGTIHYIKLHLHPYGLSVALVDKTAGKTLWKGEAKTVPGRGVLTDIDYYSSETGIPIDTTHEFEIVSVYDNTLDHVTDAMAVLRVYVADDLP